MQWLGAFCLARRVASVCRSSEGVETGLVSMPNRWQAVIFDFDFTLADSSLGAIDCVNYALRQIALPAASPAQILKTVGLSMPETLRFLTGIEDQATAVRFTRHFVSRADAVMAGLTSLYADVAPVVRRLSSARVRLGIVSSKLRRRIEDFLHREGLATGFDIVIGGGDIAERKPAPDGLLKAAKELGVPPDRAVYVGDHPVDAQAAAAASMAFVVTLSGASKAEDFAGLPCTAVIPNLSALPSALNL